MPLKQVAVKTTGPAPSKKSTDIPSFAAKEALDLSRYAQAVRDMKEAERLVAELEPGIKAEALHQLFGHNVSHTDKPVATVRLVAEGEGDNVAVVRVSFQDKYSAPNVELADAMFQELRTTEGKPGDINDYLQQAVGAKFDAKVFISAIGKDKGEFSKPVYDAYVAILLSAGSLEAVERVATRVLLLRRGRVVRVASPSTLLGERVLEVVLDRPALAAPTGFRLTPFGLQADLSRVTPEAALATCRAHRLAVRASHVRLKSLEELAVS